MQKLTVYLPLFDDFCIADDHYDLVDNVETFVICKRDFNDEGNRIWINHEVIFVSACGTIVRFYVDVDDENKYKFHINDGLINLNITKNIIVDAFSSDAFSSNTCDYDIIVPLLKKAKNIIKKYVYRTGTLNGALYFLKNLNSKTMKYYHNFSDVKSMRSILMCKVETYRNSIKKYQKRNFIEYQERVKYINEIDEFNRFSYSRNTRKKENI